MVSTTDLPSDLPSTHRRGQGQTRATTVTVVRGRPATGILQEGIKAVILNQGVTGAMTEVTGRTVARANGREEAEVIGNVDESMTTCK